MTKKKKKTKNKKKKNGRARDEAGYGRDVIFGNGLLSTGSRIDTQRSF